MLQMLELVAKAWKAVEPVDVAFSWDRSMMLPPDIRDGGWGADVAGEAGREC